MPNGVLAEVTLNYSLAEKELDEFKVWLDSNVEFSETSVVNDLVAAHSILDLRRAVYKYIRHVGRLARCSGRDAQVARHISKHPAANRAAGLYIHRPMQHRDHTGCREARLRRNTSNLLQALMVHKFGHGLSPFLDGRDQTRSWTHAMWRRSHNGHKFRPA